MFRLSASWQVQATSMPDAAPSVNRFLRSYVPISECTFRNIQATFRRVCLDDSKPKEVRRRSLEASVRAPRQPHRDAVVAAFLRDDKDWTLTAAFAMRWIRGFKPQILEALKNSDPLTQYEAIRADGNWELDETWPRAFELLKGVGTSKPLLLAAIAAASSIRPEEAQETLVDLAASEDDEIAEAANEAIALSGPDVDDEDDDEVPACEWIN